MYKSVKKLLETFSRYEFAKASVYYVIANIIGEGVVLLSSGVFTRMMDKTSYGLVSTYSTWVLVLNAMICLNLFITVRNAYIDFKEDYDRFTSTVLLLVLISGVCFTAILTAANGIAGTGISTVEVGLACIQSVALNVINYKMAVLSMRNHYKARAALMIAPNCTHTVLSILLMLIFTGHMYLAKIAGNAAGLLIFAVISAVGIFRKCRPGIVKAYWKYAVKLSVPSIFNTLSDLILIQCDRLMLTGLVGAAVTAEYSIIYNVGYIIVAINQAINGAWTPLFYKLLAQENSEISRKYGRYYILFFTVFSCGMMTVSPEIIRIIAPRTYWNGISYAGAIITASYVIFLYSFLTICLMYKKRTGAVARNAMIAAAANIVLNYLLIPEYKAIGAVIATVVSYLLLFWLHFISVGQEERQYIAVKSMLANLMLVAAYGITFIFIKNYWILRYMLYLLFAVLFMSRYRADIGQILAEIKAEDRRRH